MCFVCGMTGLAGWTKTPVRDPFTMHVFAAMLNGEPAVVLSTGDDRFEPFVRLVGRSGIAFVFPDERPDDLAGGFIASRLRSTLSNSGDQPGNSTTSATVTIDGAAVSGAIDAPGDLDWFRVNLVAGQTYTFSTGLGSTGEMDTFLTLRDANGVFIDEDDDSGAGLLSTITFTASANATYFLEVRHYSPQASTGTYTLQAVTYVAPPPDSIPADSSTTFSVGVGGSANGNIEAAGDRDWFRVELVAGQTYRFNTTASGSGTVLSDANLVLRNSAGTQVDVDTTGNEASILFTATDTGTYYLEVNGAGDGTGAYGLNAAIDAPLALATVDQIARHLTHDFWGGSSHRFNVAPGGTLTVNVTQLPADAQFLAREALALWTDVTGINFVEVATGGQIVFDDAASGAYASASFSGGITSTAQVNIEPGWLTNPNHGGTDLDSYSFQTYIHEIGHVLGLGHGGYYNGAADWDNDARFLNDSWVSTIMSYYDVNENAFFNGLDYARQFVVTPMLADAVGTTALYGVASTTRTGDTTYGFNNNSGRGVYDAAQFPSVSYTVFDHGGFDTLDYSGFSQNQRIDLRPEASSNVGGRTGNVFIARGTIIESAIGGSGNDTLIGNNAANILVGNGGFDTAQFAAGIGSYALAFFEAGRTIVRGVEGYDITVDVEQLRFADAIATGPATLFQQSTALATNAFGAAPAGGGWATNNDFPRVVGDINGDNRADIVGFGSVGTFVALGQADGTFAGMYQASGDFGQALQAGGWANNDLYTRLLGDVDGDGDADIVGFGDAGALVSLANGSGGFGPMYLATSQFGASEAAGSWQSQNLFTRTLADVNGDGRADLVGFGTGGTLVALGQANGTFGTMFLASGDFGRGVAAGGWESYDAYPRMLGDVNGDGRADVVGFGDTATFVGYGNADGTFSAMQVLVGGAFGRSASAGGWENQTQYPRLLEDANGDGLADIIGFGTAGVYYSLANGYGGFGAFTLGLNAFGAGNEAGGWNDGSRYARVLADVNGDGREDVIGFGDNGAFVTLASLFNVTALAEPQAEAAPALAGSGTNSGSDGGNTDLAQEALDWFEGEDAGADFGGFIYNPRHGGDFFYNDMLYA